MATETTIRFLALTAFKLIGTMASAQSLEYCPTFCACDAWYELQLASCTNSHLYSIHTGVSGNVQALDLSNNLISSIGNFELANAGLVRLKYLNLSGNSVSEIGLNGFNGLEHLTVLDLSRNHLYYLLSDVFAESRSLRILKLSGNNFNPHVPKLQSPWLMQLFMDSCQISHLPVDTFNGLPGLHTLDLSNNLMIQIDVDVLTPLRALKKLSLPGNPWSCNKIMYDVQIHLRRKNVQFDTLCGKAVGPEKFEKMILKPPKKLKHHPHSTIISHNLENNNLLRTNVTHGPSENNATLCGKTEENERIFASSTNDMSSYYWFFVLGFILGSACTMVISYLWLRGTSHCCERYEHRDRANVDPQRLSLLTHLWQFEDLVPSDNASLATSCPGTPPPPYREVVLRPGLYRCPPTGTNLNNNDTGCRER